MTHPNDARLASGEENFRRAYFRVAEERDQLTAEQNRRRAEHDELTAEHDRLQAERNRLRAEVAMLREVLNELAGIALAATERKE